MTKYFRVYGQSGHRQAISFGESKKYDWSTEGKTRIVELVCSDKTGTNEYTEVIITSDTAEEARRELEGQLSDGFFENSRYGRVTELTENGEIEIYGEA